MIQMKTIESKNPSRKYRESKHMQRKQAKQEER